MGTYTDRGGWNHLKIERTDEGLISVSIDGRKGRRTILMSPTRGLLRDLQTDILSAFGHGVPSAADNSLGADFSSAQEDRFAAALTRAGVAYRRSPTTRLDRRGDGKWIFCYPDFVIEGAWVIVFFDGCYFHGCPEHFRHNFRETKKRDAVINEGLRRNGWEVVRVWEHEDFDEAAHRIADTVTQRFEAHRPVRPEEDQ